MRRLALCGTASDETSRATRSADTGARFGVWASRQGLSLCLRLLPAGLAEISQTRSCRFPALTKRTPSPICTANLMQPNRRSFPGPCVEVLATKNTKPRPYTWHSISGNTEYSSFEHLHPEGCETQPLWPAGGRRQYLCGRAPGPRALVVMRAEWLFSEGFWKATLM